MTTATPQMLALVVDCLEQPRSGFHVLAAHPSDLPEKWKQDAAFFRWKNRGALWQESAEVRRQEYLAAVDALRLSMPVGLALVYKASRQVQILTFVLPRHFGCYDSSLIIRGLIDGVVDFSRREGYVSVACLLTQSDVQSILYERGFRRDGSVMACRI
ncbi:MAG: hypothetical protein ABIG34_03110 [Candidatus Peregrinibacteria bacterium]